jgi:hypothetical protein
MEKKLYLYLLSTGILLLLSVGFCHGQDKINIVPPSPNAASLGKYGDIPVSPYTGVPNIDIPIYEIVSGDIKVPISISYHASGIKVAEEASRVGLGWAINAGGVISRSVYGEDDFLNAKYFDTSILELPEGPDKGPLKWVQAGNQASMYNKVPGEPTLGTLDLSDYIHTSSSYDFQPDQYSYNFNGYSGKFVLKRNKDVVLAKQDKIKIKILDPDAEEWEIVTSDGFRYLFEIVETYTDTELTTSGTGATHKSSWYLTKIVSPAGKIVTFSYTKVADEYIKPVGAYTERSNPKSILYGTCPFFTCSTQGSHEERVPGKPYSIVILESIDFDNGRVEFDYEEREDIAGDKKLKNIFVYRKNANGTLTSPLKNFIFSYDYFVSDFDIDFPSDGPGNFVTKRLKLLSLQEFSGSDATKSKEPFVFIYYEGSGYLNLPSKNSFARDHWGYYNGKVSNHSLIPEYVAINSEHPVKNLIGNIQGNRNTNPDYVSAFSLKEIQYPAKGKTTFEYEAHTFDVKESRKRDETFFGDSPTLEETTKRVSVSYKENGDGKGAIYEQELDLTNLYVSSDSHPDTDPATAKVTLYAAVRLRDNCENTNLSAAGINISLYDSDGQIVSHVDFAEMEKCDEKEQELCVYCGESGSVLEYRNTYYLSPGIYTWKAFTSASDSDVLDIVGTYKYLREIGVDDTPGTSNGVIYDFAGGLRIKRIIDKDDISGSEKKKKYISF